jgi:GGDEF domain-containing protein
MLKVDALLATLNKAEPKLSLGDALRALKESGAPEDALSQVRRHIFVDSMTGNHGNKYAYNEFLKRKDRGGVHVHQDLSDFSHINNTHGHDIGDQAIKRYADIASKVAKKYRLKGFRTGGDEFKYHADTPEQAMGFVHEMRNKLEKEPKVGGTHNLSAAFGMGHNSDEAEESLLEAKKLLGPRDPQSGRRVPNYPPGQAPTVFHSDKLHAQAIEKEPALENPLKSEKDLVGYALLSDASPVYPVFQTKSLVKTLNDYGINYYKVADKYSPNKENYLVKLPEAFATVLAKDYGQESVIYFSQSGEGRLIYTNGVNEGGFHPLTSLKKTENEIEAIFDYNKLL